MNGLMRRDPYQGVVSLQKAMDRLFEDSFIRPAFSQEMDLALDMYETDNDVVVKLTVPGVKPEDIDVTIVGDSLIIKGTIEAEEETNERSYHVRERHYGRFVRTVTLPAPVRVDATTAEFKNGILTLTAPKREEVKPKTIQVKASQAKGIEQPRQENGETRA